MMTQENAFQDLCEQLRRGDNAAATQVFGRYAGRLIGLAQTRLGGRLRQRLDAEDVMQSVFHTFFEGLAAGQFRLPDWDSLWGLLACLTVRKCARARDRNRAGRRDITREVPLATQDGESEDAWEITGREPGPEESAILNDMLEQAMLGLTEQERQAVALALRGSRPAEVAEEIGCSMRKVYRVLERFRDRLARLHARDRGE